MRFMKEMISEAVKWLVEKYRVLMDMWKAKGHTSQDHVTLMFSLVVTPFLCLLGAFVFGWSLILNITTFAVPALATIRDANTELKDKPPSTLLGFWVLFGAVTVLEPLLRVITPCFTVAKACILIWGMTSATPYGGREILTRALSAANAGSSPFEALAPTGAVAAKLGISTISVLLIFAILLTVVSVFALGCGVGIVLMLEGLLSARPIWLQAKICNAAGVTWPLFATVKVMARADERAGPTVNVVERSKRDTSEAGRRQLQLHRQGPAITQWLSYWPLFGGLLVADSFLSWVPHYFTVKLMVLGMLALPQTEGAHFITTVVLHHEDEDRKHCSSPRDVDVVPSSAVKNEDMSSVKY
ncbi:unnamed protein product [Discosporangium mesarthrocarpum]